MRPPDQGSDRTPSPSRNSGKPARRASLPWLTFPHHWDQGGQIPSRKRPRTTPPKQPASVHMTSTGPQSRSPGSPQKSFPIERARRTKDQINRHRPLLLPFEQSGVHESAVIPGWLPPEWRKPFTTLPEPMSSQLGVWPPRQGYLPLRERFRLAPTQP